MFFVLYRFDSGRGLGGDIIGYADDAGDVVDNLASESFEGFKGQSCRRCDTCVETVPAADFDLPAEVAFSVAHAGDPVCVQNGHVLECSGVFEYVFDDNSSFADGFDAFWCHLTYYAG